MHSSHQVIVHQLDTTKNTIITYFKELGNFKEKLDTRNIATSTA